MNRKKNSIVFLILLSIVFLVSSCFKEKQAEELKDSFVRFYGGIQAGEGRVVQQLADGSFIIAGHTSNADSFGYNLFIVKANQYGDVIWQRNVGRISDEKAYGMQLLSDGGLIVAGNISYAVAGQSSSNIWLVRTNEMGDTLWSRQIGGTDYLQANNVLVKNDNGFLISGSISQAGSASDLLMVSADSNGNNIKTSSIKSDGTQQALCAAITPSGYIFIGSNAGGAGVSGSSDIFIALANEVRPHSPINIGGSGADYGKAIKALPDGGFICLANYATADSSTNFMLFKLVLDNGDLKIIWSKRFGTINSDDAAAIEITDSGFLMTGTTTNADASTDILFITTDLDGNEQNRKIIGGQGNQRAFGLCKTNDGGSAIVGSNENSGSSVLLLIKLKKTEL